MAATTFPNDFYAIVSLDSGNTAAQNRTAIQAAIDGLNDGNGIMHGLDSYGGVVLLPRGNWPIDQAIKVWSNITLRGAHITATRLVGNFAGLKIKFASTREDGLSQNNAVEDLTVYGSGDGIGLDDAVSGGTIGEGEYQRIENVLINVAGEPLKLKHRTGSDLYFTDIINVYIAGGAGGNLKWKGRGLNVDRFRFSNQRHDGAMTVPNPVVAAVDVEGDGAFANCRFEGANNTYNWGNGPLAKVSGGVYKYAWNFTNNYWEPHGADRDLFVSDSAVVVIDVPMFVQPKNPWKVNNGSHFYVTAIAFMDNEGLHPTDPDELATLKEDCYLVDAESFLYDRAVGAGEGALVIDLPSTPSQTTAYIVTYDASGNPKGNVPINFRLVDGPTGSGASFENSITATSDEDGVLQIPLLRNASYVAVRGDVREQRFRTTNTSSFALPIILGRDGG